MDNVLEGLSEPSALSPLSTDVHDEDFAPLGDSHAETIEEGNLHSDNDDSLNTSHEHSEDIQSLKEMVGVDNEDHTIGDMSLSVAGDASDHMSLSVAGDASDLAHVDSLEGQVATLQETQDPNVLTSNPVVMTSESGVLTADAQALISNMGQTHLLQVGGWSQNAGDQEGILLTTDADGNLSVPMQADHVIRLFMQTSDGNLVAADAPMQALKLSMSGLISAGAMDGSTLGHQVITLPDGTATLVQATKQEVSEANQGLPKFVQGQTIKLENGTTALLQPTPNEALQEGLQAIQLEDGSTAFITQPNPDAIFSHSLEGLNLDHLATQTILGATESMKDKHNSDKAYKCLYEECGRLYTTQHHLKVHERSHTGDRPFMCEFPNCGKAFATGYGLKSHNRVHTGEKPYPCTEAACEKAFKTSGDLQKHVRTHTGERPFKCPFEGCTRSFTTSNIRKVHIRTHTGERPYICDMEGCGRAFASATNYKNHIRIHTGEKPYVCTVQDCGKRFTEYSSLYKHHVVHTHTKPYTCGTCGKTYRQTSTLAMHKRTAHGEDFPAEIGEGGALRVSASGADGEPLAKKRMIIKTEVGLQPETSQAENNQNLMVSTSDGSQMVLLTPQGSTSDGMVSLGDGTAQLVNLATLQQNGLAGLASLPLGEGGQQVLVVTDPAQLEALQNLAAQHLNSLTQVPDGETGEDHPATLSVNIPAPAIPGITATSLGQ